MKKPEKNKKPVLTCKSCGLKSDTFVFDIKLDLLDSPLCFSCAVSYLMGIVFDLDAENKILRAKLKKAGKKKETDD